MIRKLKLIGIVAAILITVVLIPLLIKLDSLVRQTVVSQSSAALSLPTSLAAAHVSIMSESIGLLDFRVTSPPGFSAPAMLTLDAVHADLNVAHLRATPLTVDRIVVTAPTLLIEQSGGKLNLQALTDQPSRPPADGSEPMKLIIKELTIEHAKVILRAGIPGIDHEFSLDLPTVTLKNIGTADGSQNGVEMKAALLLIAKTLAAQAADSDKVPADVRAILKLNVNQIVTDEFDQLKQKATQQIDQRIDRLLERVK